MGAYIMTQGLASASLAGASMDDPVPHKRVNPFPLVRPFRTKDDRFIQLTYLIDAWFPDLARRLDRPDLIGDPRFKDEASKLDNAAALIAELEKEFSRRTMAEWCEVLVDAAGVWAPQFRPVEVLNDEQALVNGFVTPVTMDDGDTYLAAATPGQFDERPVGELRAAPQWGQHTDAVLVEWGVPSTTIDALKQSGIAYQA
jgi:crotonobetainyl-CoA:carnitine CoA-transferase CaiB-like acyl-CoA transferase